LKVIDLVEEEKEDSLLGQYNDCGCTLSEVVQRALDMEVLE